MTRLPFLRGFLRTLVGLPDSSRGYAVQAIRRELHRVLDQCALDAALAALVALAPP